QSAEKNILACLKNGISVVSGTTGWKFNEEKIEKICKQNNVGFFYSSNYSLGMNVFVQINKKLAELLNHFENYSVRIEESHHIQKLDKPSGTAITLVKDIIENHDKFSEWELSDRTKIPKIGIKSIREGEIVGEHKIIWESEIDKIIIEHEAKTRDGFALGAVIASEFLNKKTGIYKMSDLFNF
ncbi:MAG: 4-hydroxy-tetrahydrodipicolinate reductase, partial [Bacteroidales bacterium]|nr:4-hydroxy-tetrahydrodipicolinate reductase [Bacteroidales bacterium]